MGKDGVFLVVVVEGQRSKVKGERSKVKVGKGSGFPYCRYLERDNGGKRTEGLGFLSSECFFGIEF